MALPIIMIAFWKFTLLGTALYIAYDIGSTYWAIRREIEEEQLDKDVSNLLEK